MASDSPNTDSQFEQGEELSNHSQSGNLSDQEVDTEAPTQIMASGSPNTGKRFEQDEGFANHSPSGNLSDQEVDPEAPTQILERDRNFVNPGT